MKSTQTLSGEKEPLEVRAKPRYRKPEKFIHTNVFSSSVLEEGVISVDLPARNLGMSVIELSPGMLTELERCSYEILAYVLEGFGYTEIEGEEIEWRAGDAFYIPVWAWHCFQNLDPFHCARLLICDNSMQVKQLGLAMKELEKSS